MADKQKYLIVTGHPCRTLIHVDSMAQVEDIWSHLIEEAEGRKPMLFDVETGEELELEMGTDDGSVPKPALLDTPDLTDLKKACQDYLDEVWVGSYVESDQRHFIYEEAMKALFGRDYYNRLNQRIRELAGRQK